MKARRVLALRMPRVENLDYARKLTGWVRSGLLVRAEMWAVVNTAETQVG